MAIFFIINVDEDIVQLYNNKNVELFGKNLVNISLKVWQYVCQSEKHYLIFKVVILS